MENLLHTYNIGGRVISVKLCYKAILNYVKTYFRGIVHLLQDFIKLPWNVYRAP